MKGSRALNAVGCLLALAMLPLGFLLYLNSMETYTPFPGKATARFQEMQAVFGQFLFDHRNGIALFTVASLGFSIWITTRKSTRKVGIGLLVVALIAVFLAFGPGIHDSY